MSPVATLVFQAAASSEAPPSPLALAKRDAVAGIDRGGVFAAASAETLATDCADCGIAGALPPRR